MNSAALFLIHLNAHTLIDNLISYKAKSGTPVKWTGVPLCKMVHQWPNGVQAQPSLSGLTRTVEN